MFLFSRNVNLLVLSLLALTLQGCNSLPRQSGETTAVSGPARMATTAAVAPPAPASAAVPRVPGGARVRHEIPLTPDLVYGVLVGEIAAQRDRDQLSYTHYMHAARLSGDPRLAELATRSASSANDEQATRKAVELWLRLAPDRLKPHQIAALLYARDGDRSQALAHLRRVVGIAEREGAKGYLQAAAMLAKIRDPRLRLRLMGELTADQPQNPDARFAMAMVAASSHALPLAESNARTALELRPEWTQARILIVRLLTAQGKRADARKLLEQWVAESPKDFALGTAYGQLLVENREYRAALEQFLRLKKQQPENADILFALGVLALQEDDREAARGYFKTLFDLGKRKSEAAYYLGQIEEQAGRLAPAIAWYSRVKSSSRRFDAEVRIAHLWAQKGEVKRAREILQQLRSGDDSTEVRLYLIEGEILREVGRYHEAMRVYDAALKAYPDNADLLYARALQAVAIGRVDILERDLRHVIEQDPSHADALNALGYTLADETDRYREALGYIQRALKLKPNNAAVLDSMGWVQYRLGNIAEAARYLRRAIELMPDPEIAAHLGQVLWAEGQRQQARRIWDEALAKNPDSKYLNSVIQKHR